MNIHNFISPNKILTNKYSNYSSYPPHHQEMNKTNEGEHPPSSTPSHPPPQPTPLSSAGKLLRKQLQEGLLRSLSGVETALKAIRGEGEGLGGCCGAPELLNRLVV